MELLMEKTILDFRKEGYNCAESIVKAVNYDKDLNIPVSIATPFGNGMAVASTCGAVTGAMIAVGYIHGREDSEQKNETRGITKEIMNMIKEKYGTVECKALKEKGVSCNEIIEYTYELLSSKLND